MGGCGEIGKNMTLFEYENEIIILDCGVMFPQNDMLGVDLIIPDYTYLKNRWQDVKAVLITHGHEDHIGAIGHLMKKCDAPIYATALTAGFIRHKLKEAKLGNQKKIEVFQAGDTFNIGEHFKIEPFHVTHSIPDCVGFGITTPVGLIVHTGDYKIDHTPVDGWPTDFAKLHEFAERGVLCLMADSTNATNPGRTLSEQTITPALDDVFENAPGRVIVASFASLISRIWQVADSANRHKRKLALAGRSMRTNVKIAQELGYLQLPDDLMIDLSAANKMPSHRVAIMATGSQGEPMSTLGKLSRGRHPQLQIKEGDTFLISAHTIPGNEEMVYRIINNLMRLGAEVLYEETSKVHVSGHASQEEMIEVLGMVKPKFFMPVHGELRHLKHHAFLAEEMGIDPDAIAVVENGSPVEFDKDSMQVKKRLKGGYVFVQAGVAGEMNFSDIRTRERLAQAGFFLASVHIDRSGKVIGKPQYRSDGFIKLNGESELIDGVEKVIKEAAKAFYQDRAQLHSHIEGAVKRYISSEVRMQPMTYVIVHDA